MAKKFGRISAFANAKFGPICILYAYGVLCCYYVASAVSHCYMPIASCDCRHQKCAGQNEISNGGCASL